MERKKRFPPGKQRVPHFHVALGPTHDVASLVISDTTCGVYISHLLSQGAPGPFAGILECVNPDTPGHVCNTNSSALGTTSVSTPLSTPFSLCPALQFRLCNQLQTPAHRALAQPFQPRSCDTSS